VYVYVYMYMYIYVCMYIYIYIYIYVYTGKFKVCKSVRHRTFQMDHQPDATIFQFIILTFIYSSTCFGRSPAHLQELNDCSSSLWFYDTKVKSDAATTVVELLKMGGRTPETCWAVNKRQDNKLKNCCIWLVIYWNWNILVTLYPTGTNPS